MNLPKPPCHGQTEESIKEWLKSNVAVGCTVVIRNTQGHMLTYKKATVVRLGKGRFQLDQAGVLGSSSFYYSGKNCFHPKGQTRLVIPTPEVLQACEGLPDRGFGYGLSTV